MLVLLQAIGVRITAMDVQDAGSMPSQSQSQSQSRHPLLAAGPLYAFSLPPELLQALALRSPLGGHSAVGPAARNSSAANGTENGETSMSATSEVTALGCGLCLVQTFESLAEQRAHFSSDWHRYNVKRRLANKPAVRESEWDGSVDGERGSLDGTARHRCR